MKLIPSFVTISFVLCIFPNSYTSERAYLITDLHEFDLSQSIIDCWDAVSPAYLEHKLTHMHQGDLIEAAIFEELITTYAADAKIVLDAGTGNGWFASSLLKWDILDQLECIVGIDISPIMITTARIQCNDPRAFFLCSSLESDMCCTCFGLQKESVDLIISSNAFDCMQHIEEVLTKCHQLLKQDGYAIISIRHPQRNAYYATGTIDGDYQEGIYKEKWQGSGDQEIIRFYRSEETWDALFTAAGFEIVEKQIPTVADSLAFTHPKEYLHYTNKKYPGALVYVLKRSH